MYRLVLDINGLPKTPNGAHGHWRAAAAERKKWREAVCLLARFRRPPEPLKKCRITFTRFSSVQPDFDNLVGSLKGATDGLKDAGIIEDDRTSCVVDRKYLWEKAKPKEGKIQIVVEEICSG